jgi:hypothetical protein
VVLVRNHCIVELFNDQPHSYAITQDIFLYVEGKYTPTTIDSILFIICSIAAMVGCAGYFYRVHYFIFDF